MNKDKLIKLTPSSPRYTRYGYGANVCLCSSCLEARPERRKYLRPSKHVYHDGNLYDRKTGKRVYR